MTDILKKALAFNDEVRIYVVDATEMVREAQSIHDSRSVATAALGRSLIGTTLIGATLKNKQDKITLRINGGGPIGSIVVDSNMYGHTKGYIQNPHVSLDLNNEGKLNVSEAVGTEGNLVVTKDQGLKTPFVGQVPLVSGELAEDFTYYMAVSEQTPSSFGLSVLVNPDETVKVAGGFMIQVLPDTSDETIAQLEEMLVKLPQLSELLEDIEDIEELFVHLAGEGNYRVLEDLPVAFKCDCSKERFTNALKSLGKQEIQEIIDEDGQAETTCHFCQKHYLFTKEELEEIKAEAL